MRRSGGVERGYCNTGGAIGSACREASVPGGGTGTELGLSLAMVEDG